MIRENDRFWPGRRIGYSMIKGAEEAGKIRRARPRWWSPHQVRGLPYHTPCMLVYMQHVLRQPSISEC